MCRGACARPDQPRWHRYAIPATTFGPPPWSGLIAGGTGQAGCRRYSCREIQCKMCVSRSAVARVHSWKSQKLSGPGNQVWFSSLRSGACVRTCTARRVRVRIHHIQDDPFPDRPGSPAQRPNGDADISRIQQSIDLRAAGPQLSRHCIFRDALLLHGVFQLPCNDPLDSDSLSLLENSFLLEKAVECGTTVIESCCLVHASPRSCLLLLERASSRSSSGVLRVFLMNPCSRTMRLRLSI